MAFSFGNLNTYVDEQSFSLISKAVLNTDLMGKISVRAGLSAGTVAVNLMDGDFNVTARECSTFTPSGNINFSQVNIVIADKQMKMEVCPTQLRDYYMAQQMSPSAVAGGEELVFEEVMAEFYVKKIKEYNETYLMQGDGVNDGIEAQIKAGSTNIPAGAAAWTVGNAIDQALDIYDAVSEKVKDRNDIIMLVSPANYRTLTRALVAANLYHYNFTDGTETLYLPGTNCSVVKTSGLTGSDFVAAGPAEMIIAGVGLVDETSDAFGAFYVPAEDTVKIRAYWRLGVAVAQSDLFGHNNL